MIKWRVVVLSSFLILIFLSSVAVSLAACDPSDIGGNGDDTITCTGNDFQAFGNDGNDIITNDGNLYNGAFGGNDNDTITNNGDTPRLNGQAGDDTITNAGTVGTIYGGTGDDTVTLTDSPDTAVTVYGDENNGNIPGSNDVLRFEYTMASQADHAAASASIAAAAAAGGTITINGQTVTFAEFEQLVDALTAGYTVTVTVEVPPQPQYIVRDGRANPEEAGWSSAVPYCNGGGIQVYGADGNLRVDASATAIATALETAVDSNSNQTIAMEGEYGIFALFSNQIQVNGPGGYSTLMAADACA